MAYDKAMPIDKVITSALPYANGPIHLGHLVEHIQADIWVRFQRLQKQRCVFLCGDDAHGSAIMLAAQKADVEPEAWIKNIHQQHLEDLKGFHVDYDVYHSTHSQENTELSQMIYQRLDKAGLIHKKMISQAYDKEAKMFLPDRYVKGTCPKCGVEDQYGDSCEQCGAVYTPDQLIDAKSVISGTQPILKESEHFFFRLSACETLLKDWLEQGALQHEVSKKLVEWFEGGLKDWDISRDAPYFGIEIPGAPGKYFYVWLDAPIGYMAALKYWADQHDEDFHAVWSKGSSTEIIHFIGKDILYFHGLFWPAILHHADFKWPDAIYAHGFLTINGKKMSKSRGTFITARQYLESLDPDYLRYYFAAKLGPNISDIDLNWSDFVSRVNAELIGKLVNIGSRCACFIHRHFNGVLSDRLSDEAFYQQVISQEGQLRSLYEARDYNQCLRLVVSMADQINQYLDQTKPWIMAKDPNQLADVGPICTLGVSLFYSLMGFISPVIPGSFERVKTFMRLNPNEWQDFLQPVLNHRIEPFPRLLERVDAKQVASMDHAE